MFLILFFFPGRQRWAAEGRLRAPRLQDGRSELVIPKVPAGLAPTYPSCCLLVLQLPMAWCFCPSLEHSFLTTGLGTLRSIS